jgi:hypothetical protein
MQEKWKQGPYATSSFAGIQWAVIRAGTPVPAPTAHQFPNSSREIRGVIAGDFGTPRDLVSVGTERRTALVALLKAWIQIMMLL